MSPETYRYTLHWPKSSFVFQDTSYRWENLNELFGKLNGKLGPQKRQIISLPFCAIPFQGVVPVQTLGLLSVLTSSFFKALSIILLLPFPAPFTTNILKKSKCICSFLPDSLPCECPFHPSWLLLEVLNTLQIVHLIISFSASILQSSPQYLASLITHLCETLASVL